MSLEVKKSTVLIMNYIGEDFWSRPVYRDQYDHLWKDVELGDCNPPILYAAVNNEFEGDPDTAIKRKFIIEQPNPTKEAKRFQYQMLGRMQSDCNYYLSYGNRKPGRLWAGTEAEHIAAMKVLWLSFSEDEKPLWLTWEQILEYEKKMCIEL